MRRLVLFGVMCCVLVISAWSVARPQTRPGVGMRPTLPAVALRPYGPCPGGVPSC
jgi:hypothetical protein